MVGINVNLNPDDFKNYGQYNSELKKLTKNQTLIVVLTEEASALKSEYSLPLQVSSEPKIENEDQSV